VSKLYLDFVPTDPAADTVTTLGLRGFFSHYFVLLVLDYLVLIMSPTEEKKKQEVIIRDATPKDIVCFFPSLLSGGN
jgi:hypothetical protein